MRKKRLSPSSVRSHIRKINGISDKNIYAWIKRYAKDKQTGISQDEYLKLKKAYQKIQEENEILKKVLTIFAKN